MVCVCVCVRARVHVCAYICVSICVCPLAIVHTYDMSVCEPVQEPTNTSGDVSSNGGRAT